MQRIDRIKSYLNNDRFIALILFAASFAVLSCLNPNTLIVSIYQSRDIHHALDLLNGKFVWYGPDFFGGGKTPGPFYYWLLALPLFVTNTWHSLLPFCNIMAALALAWLYLHLQKMYSRFVGLVAVLFLLSNSIFIENLKSFWNPSYLPLFLVALIWFFTTMSVQKPLRLLTGFFVLALAAQIHFSMTIFLLPALFSLNSMSFESKQQKVSIMLLSLLSFALPFIPFLLTEFNSDLSEGALALAFPFRKWAHNLQINAGFFNNLLELFKVNIFLLPSCLLFFVKPEYAFKKNKFLSYSFLFSAVSLAWLCYNPMFFRYTVPFFVLLMLAQALHLEKIYKSSKLFFKIWLAAVTLNFIYVVWPSASANEPLYNENGYFSEQSFAGFNDLSQVIVEKTGWNYEEFRKKTYVLGLSRETDLSLVYEDAYRKNEPTLSSYSGVIAVRNDAGSLADWSTLQGILPDLLIELAKKRELTCALLTKSEFFQYCFYEINSTDFPTYLNNIGYSYKYRQTFIEENLIDPNEKLIIVQDLASSELTTLNYFHIQVRNKQINFAAYGDPIGVEDNASNPGLASNFKNVELVVECGSQLNTFKVAEHIGYEKRRKSFLAPFSLTLNTACAAPIKKITLQGQRTNLVTSDGYFSDGPFQYNLTF